MSELLSTKEIGAKLKRGRSYMLALRAAMHASGHSWPAGRITLAEVVAWLSDNPEFRSTWRRRGKERAE